MTQRNRPRDEMTSLTSTPYGEPTAAPAGRGGVVVATVRLLATSLGAFHRTVEEAYRLRSLASLSDRRLDALGLSRGDLPGLVYGWTRERPPEASPVAGMPDDRAARPPSRKAA